ncbi:MAG TPA: hypothetical protein PK685_00835 [archaeon]|jgi:hypothetical protein|nr:hypothetical protein [archaeon]
MTKGFVTIEYVLIFAGILSILAVISTVIITLYSRNLNAIDNYRLKEKCKEINQTIEFFELMPEGLKQIELNNLFEWNIEQKLSTKIILKNKQKECLIFSRLNLISVTHISKNYKLTISKQNNNLNIS